LGAGFSAPAGLLQWKALLAQLYEHHGLRMPSPSTHSLEEIAGRLKHEKFGDDDWAFNVAVREALYRGVDMSFDALRRLDGVVGVGALAMSSKRGALGSVITLNFDDVLETYLRMHGFVVESVPLPNSWASNADVEVFHPHGLLPFDLSAQTMSPSITFTNDDFDRATGDPANSWNQLVLSVLRRNTCLFIGISGRDAALNSLLATVHKGHAARLDATPYWGVAFTDKNDETRRVAWKSKGIRFHVLDSFDDLPRLLMDIARRAGQM
jgi:hypothetical protein